MEEAISTAVEPTAHSEDAQRKRMMSSLAVSLAFHILAIGVFLLIIAAVPSESEDLQIEVVLNPVAAPARPAQSANSQNRPAQQSNSTPAEAAPLQSPAQTNNQSATAQTQSNQSANNTPAQTQNAAAQSAPAQNNPGASSGVQSSQSQNDDWRSDPLLNQQSNNSSTTSTDISSFLNNNNSANTDTQVEQWRNQSQTESAPVNNAPTQSNSTQTQNTQSSDVDPALAAQLQQLKDNLNSNYNTNSAQSSTTSTAQNSSNASTDSRITWSGASTQRFLISSDRLDLGKYIQQRQTNWPQSITVRFQVDAAGFTRILNETELSAYTQLAVNIYRLFQGQVFTASPGADPVQGQIVFALK